VSAAADHEIRPVLSAAPPASRRIWLCADDYGMSPGVDRAIRQLAARERLNATSVMVVAPAFERPEALQLAILNGSKKRLAIGLHLTLTAPYRPLFENFAPLTPEGTFFPVGETLTKSVLRKFRRKLLIEEIEAQLAAFVAAFGHKPDFIDGHQHVHLFPQIGEALLVVMKQDVPGAWVRQCGRVTPRARFADRKGLLLDVLSYWFRSRAQKLGVKFNPGFAGTYDFTPQAAFSNLFPGFLDGLPDGGVVMCHPGFVDDELKRLDPLTDLREKEYAYLVSEAFTDLLAARGIVLGT
jgi:predicted glycoside hydrolase/deacetylase ChbG (UPF0249 family)